MHNKPDEQHPGPEHTHHQPGYETTDVNIGGILVFIASLAVFVVVLFVVCFGIGKLINESLIKRDGPASRWHQTAPEGNQLNNMANNAEELQKQMQSMTQNFPTPRLEIDDGDNDLNDIRVREDLLLDHYSWANAEHTKVRIPIERAMELLTENGKIAVAPNAAAAQEQDIAKMTGAGQPAITIPLTNGSAPTAYEIRMNEIREQRMRDVRPQGGQARLEQPVQPK